MKRMIKRVALAAVLGLTLSAITGGTAAALTVSPSGSFVALSGALSWTKPSNGQPIPCTGSGKSMTLTSAGTGTIAAGSATFAGCTFASQPVAVTQPVGWTVTTALGPGFVDLVITVPAGGLRFSHPGCTFTLTGAITKRASVSGLPASIGAFSVIADTLRIGGNNGGILCGFFPTGLAMDLATTLAVSPAMVVSG